MIGAGKTTLATELGSILGIPVYYEPVIDNVYLDDFYKDMKSNAFSLEVYLLTKRFEQHHQLVWSKQGGVQDRTIYEDRVFALMLKDQGMITERDYNTYVELFAIMSKLMGKPTVMVHLDVSPEESMRRIWMRNRECEKGITLEYLTDLHSHYETFIKEISRSVRVVRVDYEKFTSARDIVELIGCS